MLKTFKNLNLILCMHLYKHEDLINLYGRLFNRFCLPSFCCYWGLQRWRYLRYQEGSLQSHDQESLNIDFAKYSSHFHSKFEDHFRLFIFDFFTYAYIHLKIYNLVVVDKGTVYIWNVMADIFFTRQTHCVRLTLC